jgi:hypothetical protein
MESSSATYEYTLKVTIGAEASVGLDFGIVKGEIKASLSVENQFRGEWTTTKEKTTSNSNTATLELTYPPVVSSATAGALDQDQPMAGLWSVAVLML